MEGWTNGKPASFGRSLRTSRGARFPSMKSFARPRLSPRAM
jgi:hypothetical protein